MSALSLYMPVDPNLLGTNELKFLSKELNRLYSERLIKTNTTILKEFLENRKYKKHVKASFYFAPCKVYDKRKIEWFCFSNVTAYGINVKRKAVGITKKKAKEQLAAIVLSDLYHMFGVNFGINNKFVCFNYNYLNTLSQSQKLFLLQTEIDKCLKYEQ